MSSFSFRYGEPFDGFVKGFNGMCRTTLIILPIKTYHVYVSLIPVANSNDITSYAAIRQKNAPN